MRHQFGILALQEIQVLPPSNSLSRANLALTRFLCRGSSQLSTLATLQMILIFWGGPTESQHPSWMTRSERDGKSSRRLLSKEGEEKGEERVTKQNLDEPLALTKGRKLCLHGNCNRLRVIKLHRSN